MHILRATRNLYGTAPIFSHFHDLLVGPNQKNLQKPSEFQRNHGTEKNSGGNHGTGGTNGTPTEGMTQMTIESRAFLLFFFVENSVRKPRKFFAYFRTSPIEWAENIKSLKKTIKFFTIKITVYISKQKHSKIHPPFFEFRQKYTNNFL